MSEPLGFRQSSDEPSWLTPGVAFTRAAREALNCVVYTPTTDGRDLHEDMAVRLATEAIVTFADTLPASFDGLNEALREAYRCGPREWE